MSAELVEDTQPALNPNTAQRSASDPLTSVWVGASAGSGKTKVLADRVLRLLLAGVAPQRILCLTFTRAAAAQMAIRVTQYLSHWATCADDVLIKELGDLQNTPPTETQCAEARCLFARVLNSPGGMRIRTIHAFGQEILRRFPLEAGLPPQFAVLDETEAQALRSEALDALMRQACADPDAPLGRALTVLVPSLGEGRLEDLLREATAEPERLEDALAQAGGLDGLVGAMRRLLDMPRGDEAHFLDAAVRDDCFAVEALRTAARVVMDKGSASFATRAASILDWLALGPVERRAAFGTYSRLFLKADGAPYQAYMNKGLAQDYPEFAQVFLDEAERLMRLAEQVENLRVVTETKALLVLAQKLMALYVERKQAQAVLDYDDLIRSADLLLRREGIAPWVLFKLDGGIDHILVDEAQDTSPAQWRVVAVLADEFFSDTSGQNDKGRTLFVVGDEKQSIYSFLKADPATFARMRAHFSARIEAARAGGYREVPLTVSFRSAPAILKAVDAVFAADAARSGVSVAPVCHQAWRGDAAGRVEVWPVIAPPQDEKDSDGSGAEAEETWSVPLTYEHDSKPAATLALRIADRVAGWLRDKVLVRGRPMQAGDIMILVRRRNAFVDHLVRALKERHVPVSGVDRMRLTEQLAVCDMIALMQFTLLPEDDLTLATVLRGPLLGMDEEGLMALALGRDGSLWQALQEAAPTNPKANACVAYLRAWCARADQVPPFVMVAEILNTPCPADSVSGKRALWARLGPDALDPLDELLNAAQDFSVRHAPSLQAFLHWLTSSETEIKRELDQGGGLVRITTVHASKGLEAPVVILPDTTTLPEKTKLARLLWAPTEAVPFYVPGERRAPLLKKLRETAWQKQMEEYRRLLYVALTRAADHLVICGYENKRADKSGQTWYALVAEALQALHDPSLHAPGAVLAFADPVRAAQEPDEKQTAAPADKNVGTEGPLPPWLFIPAAAEPRPPRPLVPSRPALPEPATATPRDVRFARGRLIHRLLQNLPDLATTERAAATRRFLAQPQHRLAEDEQDRIAREVQALLDHPSFAPLFGPDSRAEVPIVGQWHEHVISGQIDRICLLPAEVWIVDYKTNRPPPRDTARVPEVYRRQLAAYRAVLSEIYPERRVRCFLLWTYAPHLMEIPDDLLPAP